jgi:hypothetical protein
MRCGFRWRRIALRLLRLRTVYRQPRSSLTRIPIVRAQVDRHGSVNSRLCAPDSLLRRRYRRRLPDVACAASFAIATP